MLLYTKASFSVLANISKTQFYILENFSLSPILQQPNYQVFVFYFGKYFIFDCFLTNYIWSSCKVLLNLQL